MDKLVTDKQVTKYNNLFWNENQDRIFKLLDSRNKAITSIQLNEMIGEPRYQNLVECTNQQEAEQNNQQEAEQIEPEQVSTTSAHIYEEITLACSEELSSSEDEEEIELQNRTENTRKCNLPVKFLSLLALLYLAGHLFNGVEADESHGITLTNGVAYEQLDSLTFIHSHLQMDRMIKLENYSRELDKFQDLINQFNDANCVLLFATGNKQKATYWLSKDKIYKSSAHHYCLSQGGQAIEIRTHADKEEVIKILKKHRKNYNSVIWPGIGSNAGQAYYFQTDGSSLDRKL